MVDLREGVEFNRRAKGVANRATEKATADAIQRGLIGAVHGASNIHVFLRQCTSATAIMANIARFPAGWRERESQACVPPSASRATLPTRNPRPWGSWLSGGMRTKRKPIRTASSFPGKCRPASRRQGASRSIGMVRQPSSVRSPANARQCAPSSCSPAGSSGQPSAGGGCCIMLEKTDKILPVDEPFPVQSEFYELQSPLDPPPEIFPGHRPLTPTETRSTMPEDSSSFFISATIGRVN